jgi:8-oxo-dGTP diphosphatase
MIKCILESGKEVSLRHVTVDALVVQDSKILLVKRAENSLLEGGKYALPGGYVDRNENLEQAIKRELNEETGYEVLDVILFRINDNPHRKGEDRQNIDFVYLVKNVKKVSESDDEVSEVKWFELDHLPIEDKFAFDHYENIKMYLNYLSNPLNLPIMQ